LPPNLHATSSLPANSSSELRARCRAEQACRELLAEGILHDGPADRDTIASVLAAFSRAELLDLPSFADDTSGLAPDDLRQMVAAIEVLARHSGTLASIYMVNVILGGAIIALAGSERQKLALLPLLRTGQLRLAFAMTEPQAGSDAAGIATIARRDGEAYRLTGEKIYATGAATADWIIVVGRAEEHAERKRAVSLFLVPRWSEGISVEPLPKLAGDAHASCRVTLEDVRVTQDQVLGGARCLGEGWDLLRRTGSLERLVVAAMALGLASAVVERAVAFALSREQFGRTIASFQSIQHALVEMRTVETGMRLFVAHALGAMERQSDSDEAASMAKYFCAEQLQRLVGQGMRVMGGRAFFEFEEMARYYREAPFTLYAGGTIEIQKMIIARGMGLPTG